MHLGESVSVKNNQFDATSLLLLNLKVLMAHLKTQSDIPISSDIYIVHIDQIYMNQSELVIFFYINQD